MTTAIFLILAVCVVVLWSGLVWSLYRAARYRRVRRVLHDSDDWPHHPDVLWFYRQDARPAWRKKLMP